MKNFTWKMGALAILGAAAIFGQPAPAKAQSSPDLILEWTYRTEDPEAKKVHTMLKCRLGTCTEVDLDPFTLTSREGSGPLEAEVEVCHAVNAWTDRCDVYDCYDDPVGLQSVCDFQYSYNKSCLLETCSGT